MEKLTPKLKEELLKGLQTIDIKYDDFEHNLEDSNTTYAKITKRVETDNLNIDIEFEEMAIWTAYDDYETNDFQITSLEVNCENGLVDTCAISDDELLKHINY